MVFLSQLQIIMEALDVAAASGKYTNKVQIITAVSDSLKVPRPTVRHAKAKLLKKLAAKIKILEQDE